MIRKLLFTLFIVLIHTFGYGATKTYSGSGNWNVAANWSGGTIPGGSDDVIISSGQTVTVTMNDVVNAFVNNLSVLGTGILTINDGKTLTIYGNVTVDSGARFNAGTGNSDSAIIKVYGDFINQGTANFWKSTVVIAGNLVTASTILQNNGNIIVGGNVSGVIGGSGTGIVYPVNPNATVTVTGDATEKPAGTIPTDSTLLSFMNEVIYGTNCSFTITGTTNISACIGATAIFTVTTSGSSPSYQWEVNMGSGWSDLSNNTFYSGVNTANLAVNNITAGMNNYKFRARITAAGCTEKGNYGFLTVSTSPTIITQPINQLDCEKRSVNFSVVATGTGLTYSWKYKKPADPSFTTITAATSNVSNSATSTISISNIGSTQFPNGTQFQVVVSNGTCDVSSSLATLSVNEILDITSGTTVTMCYGSNHFYTVTTSYPSNVVSYKWKKSVSSGVWNDVVDGTHYSGATTATLNIINGTPAETAEYRVYITFRSSGADCNASSDSRTRALTFLPLLLTPATVITQPSCSTPTGTVSVTVQSATDTYSFDNGSTFQAGNSKSGLAAGIYKVIIKNSGGCNSPATSATVKSATNIWDGSVWSNGTLPTISENIVFNGNYLSSGDVSGCSCQINSGAVVINSGHTLSLTNELKVVGGSLTFENSASLIQTNTGSGINTGTVIYKRNSTPIINDDYTYWSSPTSGTQTLLDFSPYTQGDKFFIFDNDWSSVNTSSTFSPGIGYSIRAPEGISSSVAAVVSFHFTGIPNNGTIAVPVTSRKDASGYEEGLRLVGNPFPSALDADAFIDANITVSGTINKTITGTLYFWTHNHTLIGNDYLATDYATYTKFGGTGTGSAMSGTGNSGTPVKYIASGQGFFVEVDATGNVTFNNAMRGAANNANFYKTTTKKTASSESHRVWLNLTNNSRNFSQALMGYSSMATNEYDSGVDGVSFDGDQHSIYSLIGERMLAIQAKALPFDDTDTIPLGYVVNVAGNTVISIDHVDGMFEKGQGVYLEDLVLGVIHDIKTAPYVFSSEAGTFNDRFVLRFKSGSKSLGTYSVERLNSAVVVSNKDKHIKINSSEEVINKVQVYDLLGRLIFQKTNVNANEYHISNLVSNHQVLLAKIILQNGQTVTKKIVY
ncbi:T9SS sorting signal type C domain-containing protein [Flavobacterium xinjiangense]|uniref:Por secretion system C-terminal sorting domain-containing protein n=1 Tax=Flavobacterium xinjiangense TaxID=178356 RepID=A0A1M7F775_9FLAO|nr:T9SS sorting signal type C domain-containing protein [Flavobacterium xinjiangense]SHL99823.1 hypothetical protein SAMN05216269_10259 [Flavobacterium xinjiangense]